MCIVYVLLYKIYKESKVDRLQTKMTLIVF